MQISSVKNKIDLASTAMFVKASVLLFTLFSTTANARNQTAYDRMGSRTLGEDWNKVKNASSQTDGAASKLESFITGLVDMIWLIGIGLGAASVLIGLYKYITAVNNQQPIKGGIVWFVGGLFSMILGFLSWRFSAEIKNFFL